MRRLVTIALVLALCLCLAACQTGGAAQQPDAPDSPAAPDAPPSAEPLRLERLDVEFVVDGGRLADDAAVEKLFAMQSALPEQLIDALAAQGVEVGGVAVTFGASGEATETALRSGAVRLAFLSAEDYYPYRSGMIVAVERGEAADLSLGLLVAAASDDAEADERLVVALRAALPALADTLAPYAGEAAKGVYEYDEARIEQLAALYEEETKTAQNG